MLKAYHRLEPGPKTILIKSGMRFYPDYHPALELLLKKLPPLSGYCLDASATAGALAVLLGWKGGVVVDSSCASLRAATANLREHKHLTLLAAPLWAAPKTQFDALVSILPSDKGTIRVEAECLGIHHCLKPEGLAYVVMHKDQGAKRYESQLTKYFKQLKVVAKDKGWRLLQLSEKNPLEHLHKPLSFEASGLKLQAEPGVYAAGKLDPGTEFFLASYDLKDVAGKEILDLGCGYGLIALKAALAGAQTTALDDDLLAVQSTYHNAKTYGLDIRCLHSDINSELKETELFDLVLTNPPFHIGRGVRLELPQAFIAAAHKHLKIGGELLLVANKALAYEPLLEGFSYWEKLASNQAFKVLRAIK